MKNRVTFYLFVLALVVLDAVLLRSPNLLGKIGLIIYKYSYLRTFPKALITVSIVIGVAVAIAELLRLLAGNASMKRTTARTILFVLLTIAVAAGIKTWFDFTAWSYSHTGLRFRLGAYLLPVILAVVFGYHVFTLPKLTPAFPESPTTDEEKNQEQKPM